MAGVLQDGSQAWTKPLTLLAGGIRASDQDPPMKLEVKLTNSFDFGIFLPAGQLIMGCVQ